MNIFKKPIAAINNRNHLLDFLKFFGLLMVIFDHCSQRWISGIQNTQLYNFIFITQMPLFFFISGYLFIKTDKREKTYKEIAHSFLKTAMSLLVPFFTFPIISSLFQNGWNENLWTLTINAIKSPSTYSLWFLWALFWIKTFGFISKTICLAIKKKKENLKTGLVFPIIFLLFVLFAACLYFVTKGSFGTKLIIYYSLFFLVGYFASNHRILETTINLHSKVIVLAICFLLLAIIMKSKPCMIFDSENIINIIIRFLASIISIASCLLLFSLFSNFLIFKKLSCLGTLSLEFYVTHILLFSTDFFNSAIKLNGAALIFAFVCLYILFFIMSLIVILILKSNIVTDFFFYGKLPSFKNEKTFCGLKNKKSNVCGMVSVYILVTCIILSTFFILPNKRTCGNYWFIDESNSQKELISLDVWSNASYSLYEKIGSYWVETKHEKIEKWKLAYQPTNYEKATVEFKSPYQVALYDCNWAGYFAFFFVEGKLYSTTNTLEGGTKQKCFLKS